MKYRIKPDTEVWVKVKIFGDAVYDRPENEHGYVILTSLNSMAYVNPADIWQPPHIDIRKWWANAREIVERKSIPGAISDGFLADFDVGDLRAELTPTRSTDQIFCLGGCIKLLRMDSEGRIDSKGRYELYAYRFHTLDREECRIQKPLAEYFIRRYPGCAFWFEGKDKPVAVKVNAKVVGVVMPIISKAKYYPLLLAKV